mgnify:CR=1 FL=1
MKYGVRRTPAFTSASLVLVILLVSITYSARSLWTYFTNWGLSLQFAAYVSVLDDSTSRQHLVDAGILVSWTVAVSYSVVIAISHETRDHLYALYGADVFWLGNIVLHYLPPLLISVCVDPTQGSFWVHIQSAVIVSFLVIVYNLSHDTEDVYDSDVLSRTEGALYMVLACFVLVFVVFNFHVYIKALRIQL